MQNDGVRARVGPVCLALLPLLVWPGLMQPFSTPKLAALSAAAALLTMLGLVAPAPVPVPPIVQWLALGWTVGFLIAAGLSDLPAVLPLVLGLAAPAFALAIVRTGARPRDILAGQVLGATACAAVALAQWAGWDPFMAWGWHPPIDGSSIRMRVYGTLGNPNFVGVLMAMSVPLTLGLHRHVTSALARRVTESAVGLQVLALAATGSRGAVLGLSAATGVYAVLRWSRRTRLVMAGLAAFGVVAVVASPARPLDTTAAGRLHLWRIVAPQVDDALVAGQGPGAVALRFPEWQRAAAREGVRDRRFAGLTDHVHNDYLEALVERGVPGLISLLAPLLSLAWLAWRLARPASSFVAGSIAAVVAASACALVDFPLARPVELTWWWMGVSLAWRVAHEQESRNESADRHV